MLTTADVLAYLANKKKKKVQCPNFKYKYVMQKVVCHVFIKLTKICFFLGRG